MVAQMPGKFLARAQSCAFAAIADQWALGDDLVSMMEAAE